MKKKILIVSPMALPVPDVMGGAIERLITMLIEENEKEQLCDLCVISSYNEEAARLSSSYKHCDVRYIKPSGRLINYLCRKSNVAITNSINSFHSFRFPNLIPWEFFELINSTKDILERIDGRQAMTDKLKPCPFCGGEAAIVK